MLLIRGEASEGKSFKFLLFSRAHNFRWKETLRPLSHSRSIVKSTPTHTHKQLPCRWGISFQGNCFHFFYVFIIKINFIAQLVGLLLQKKIMLMLCSMWIWRFIEFFILFMSVTLTLVVKIRDPLCHSIPFQLSCK